MFLSNLFFKNSKRTGRSFGRISIRHRGGGFSSRFNVSFNFSYFKFFSYFLKRFCFFSPIQKTKYLNVFSFSKSFNKLVFYTQSFYRSFDVFSIFSTNTRSDFPLLVEVLNPQLLKFSGVPAFFSEESDYCDYSPFQTNFLYVTNGCFINQIFKNFSASRSTYANAFFSYAKFIRKTGLVAYVKLPSRTIIQLGVFCRFNFFGYGERLRASNVFVTKKNAGSNRRLGIRPSVRGVAINPVDHPHGGRTGESRPSVSPWAQLTKGYPTVRKFKRLRILGLNDYLK